MEQQVYREECVDPVVASSDADTLIARRYLPQERGRTEALTEKVAVSGNCSASIKRIVAFFGFIVLLIFGLSVLITSGLKRIKTSQYGTSNRIIRGDINAQIVITGSSRAASHYDPRIIQERTGRSAFNLGRNGSQTDMQIAVLKAYLEHNRKPDVIIHNLDGFTFTTTREVYDPGQYVPYLSDEEIYRPLRQINPMIWRSRYMPLYGYVVDDMRFNWVTGLKGWVGWQPREDFFQGFNPRPGTWSDDFSRFKADNPQGVSWEIESGAIQLVEDLIRFCQDNKIQLVLVYSPEYSEMQTLTKNRSQIFDEFHKLAGRYGVPMWDYSKWKYSDDTAFFNNSQHLNARGAQEFSSDLADNLGTFLLVQATASSK